MISSPASDYVSAAVEPSPEAMTGKRIMVVEDDPGLMALYCILLHARGYRVISAHYRLAPVHRHPAHFDEDELARFGPL